MEPDHQTEEYQPPIVMAAVACLLCLLAYHAVKKQIEFAQLPAWVEFLIGSLLPIAVVFMILIRSRWHLELGKTTRMLSMLLTSGIIYGCVLVVTFFIIIAASIFFSGSMVSG